MEERFWNILAKKLNKEATPEELSELESLTKNNHHFEEYAKDASRITEIFDVDTSTIQPNAEKVRSAYQQQQTKIIDIKRNRKRILQWATGIAASILLAIGCWHYFSEGEKQQIYASEMEKKEIILEDGTIIWLNKNSSLTVDSKFNEGNRRVQLNGEAYFEVAANKNLPFEVESKYSSTKVIGTSFNIRSLEKDSIITLSVLSGKVQFVSKQTKQTVFLIPSHYASLNLNSGNIITDTLINPNVLAWKNEFLAFDDVEVRDIISTLESYFCMSIEVDDKTILNCRYTGTFEKPTIDEFFMVFVQSLNLDYKILENKVLIFGKGCRNEINS